MNLNAKAEIEFSVSTMSEPEERPPDRRRRLITQFIQALPKRSEIKPPPDMGFFDVISKSLDTMQNTIARCKLAAYSPDVIIDIPRNVCGFYEFHRGRELIEIGRQRAARALATFVTKTDDAKSPRAR